jgi:hypothetical protein
LKSYNPSKPDSRHYFRLAGWLKQFAQNLAVASHNAVSGGPAKPRASISSGCAG